MSRVRSRAADGGKVAAADGRSQTQPPARKGAQSVAKLESSTAENVRPSAFSWQVDSKALQLSNNVPLLGTNGVHKVVSARPSRS